MLAVYGLLVKPQMTCHLRQYAHMKKLRLKQVLADNLARAMSASRNLKSQPKLAAKSGVGQSTIGRILRAETFATVDSIENLANALHIPAYKLLDPDAFAPPGGVLHEQKTEYSVDSQESGSDWADDFFFDMTVYFPKLSKAGKHAVMATLYRELEKSEAAINDKKS